MDTICMAPIPRVRAIHVPRIFTNSLSAKDANAKPSRGVPFSGRHAKKSESSSWEGHTIDTYSLSGVGWYLDRSWKTFSYAAITPSTWYRGKDVFDEKNPHVPFGSDEAGDPQLGVISKRYSTAHVSRVLPPPMVLQEWTKSTALCSTDESWWLCRSCSCAASWSQGPGAVYGYVQNLLLSQIVEGDGGLTQLSEVNTVPNIPDFGRDRVGRKVNR